jgi:DNA-binding beta-propeller fold protein YncE
MTPSPVRLVLAASLIAIAAHAAPAPKRAAAMPAAKTTTEPAVVQRIPIGGDGGWDYLTVDTLGHRLFVSRSTRVQVVDLVRDTLAGEIPDTPGVHGIALAPDLGRGYTSNGRDSSVTVFDLRTLAVLSRVHVTGRNPDAILYDPATHRVLTMNGGSGTATVIVAGPDTVAGTIALGGRPEFAVADGRGRVFANLEDSSRVVVIDPVALSVVGRHGLGAGEEPSGLAMDRESRRLFVGCGNRLMVVLDADSGAIVDTLGIGNGVDATGFDPGNHLAYSSNGEGTLTIVREQAPDRFTTVTQLPTQRGARTMAVDPTTHHVYLATAQFGPPPAPTPERPHPRGSMLPGSFVILDVRP